MRHLGLLFAPILILCSCSTRRPVLYPNAALLSADPQTIEAEIDRCMNLAKTYTGDPNVARAKEMAEESALLSVAGAVTGTAIGAVTGDLGQAAAVGAIAGASGGITRGILDHHDGWDRSTNLYRSFVERCLADKGLDTIGWK